MRVLYFGTYERDYPRNAQVISCLRRAGVEVARAARGGLGGAPRQLARRRRRRRAARCSPRLGCCAGRADRRRRVIVGYPGHFDLPARRACRARAAGRLQPARLAVRTRFVADRGALPPGLAAARALEAVDRRALRAADLVVADTRANADAPRRARRAAARARRGLPSSAPRSGSSRPAGRRRSRSPCLFVGKLIPLHGVETVLAAARLAPRAALPGRRQRPARARCCASGPRTSSWVPWVEYEQLPGELHRAGCALGIFGTSDEGGAGDPEQGVPGARLRDAARHRRHARPRASCSSTARARCSSRPATRRRWRGRCAGSPATRRSRSGSPAAAARPTRRRRARTCSARAGAP